jgi:hypothetical protein
MNGSPATIGRIGTVYSSGGRYKLAQASDSKESKATPLDPDNDHHRCEIVTEEQVESLRLRRLRFLLESRRPCAGSGRQRSRNSWCKGRSRRPEIRIGCKRLRERREIPGSHKCTQVSCAPRAMLGMLIYGRVYTPYRGTESREMRRNA